MDDIYHCDGCGEEITFEDTNWFTSSIGLCDHCHDRLTDRVPPSVLYYCYDECDGGSDECAEFIINMASPEVIL